jgi:hypothetical protein
MTSERWALEMVSRNVPYDLAMREARSGFWRRKSMLTGCSFPAPNHRRIFRKMMRLSSAKFFQKSLTSKKRD